jgi:hypothetical protein
MYTILILLTYYFTFLAYILEHESIYMCNFHQFIRWGGKGEGRGRIEIHGGGEDTGVRFVSSLE